MKTEIKVGDRIIDDNGEDTNLFVLYSVLLNKRHLVKGFEEKDQMRYISFGEGNYILCSNEQGLIRIVPEKILHFWDSCKLIKENNIPPLYKKVTIVDSSTQKETTIELKLVMQTK